MIDIHEKCKAAGVPFFFKPWGGKNKKRNGRLLYGKHFDEMPVIRRADNSPSNDIVF